MSRSFEMKIDRKEFGEYEISIHLAEGWDLIHKADDSDLEKMIEKINEVRGVNSVMKLFNCTEEQALILLTLWGERSSYRSSGNTRYLTQNECTECQFKRKECFKCRFICDDSPLERSLLLEFRKRDIDPILQRRIRKDGSMYDHPAEVERETILTIPDFYLEGEHEKVCIYADGGTYHYNNERQGIRDRSIDIALQNLGFKVLRYTGSQIRDNVAAVVDNILESVH